MSSRTLVPALAGLFAFSILTAQAAPPAAAPAPKTAATGTNAAPAKPSAPLTPVEQSAVKVKDAMVMMNQPDKPDIDGALAALTEAIKLDPKNVTPYVLRSALYNQKKQWPQAEADIKAALAMKPDNMVLQMNYAQLKYKQRQFDAARTGFQKFVKDPEMGDYASYLIFLCDLYGGHQAQAAKELAAFNDAGDGPSYYFANAAWSLYNKKIDDGRGWLVSASRIFPLRKNSFYAMPMSDMGYLPLPEPAGTAPQ